MKDKIEIPLKLNKLSNDPGIPLLCNSKGRRIGSWRESNTHVDSRFIPNREKVEATQMHVYRHVATHTIILTEYLVFKRMEIHSNITKGYNIVDAQ